MDIIEKNKNDAFKIILIKIMWIESNSNYLSSIFKIFLILKINFKSEKIFIKKIEEIINSAQIRYIINPKKNPEITREVNECYYILLASLCKCALTPYDDDTPNLENYFQSLKDSLKIFKDLNDDLVIFLNEMYIIDEFLEIRNYLEKNENIKNVRNNIIQNADILQSTVDEKYEKLIENINELYELITKSLSGNIESCNELLTKIFYKEIKKVPDINYRERIFIYLIKEKEIIINSKETFYILLKQVNNPEKEGFKDSIQKILFSNDIILKKIEDILKDNKKKIYIALSETLFYFFEKNSFIYLSRFTDEKTKKTLDDEILLKLFEDCIIFLLEYKIFPNKYLNNNKTICKLFCFAFIKSFCYIFITYIKKGNKKTIEISNIIKMINQIDNKTIFKKKKSQLRDNILPNNYKYIYLK